MPVHPDEEPRSRVSIGETVPASPSSSLPLIPPFPLDYFDFVDEKTFDTRPCVGVRKERVGGGGMDGAVPKSLPSANEPGPAYS